jgi:hypothetical protein
MTIETKYEIGATVWLMAGNKPIEAIVTKITTETWTAPNGEAPIVSVGYKLFKTGTYFPESIQERLLYPDKQSLLKTL